MYVRRVVAIMGSFAVAGAMLSAPAFANPADDPVPAEITVPKVEGMGTDWINGVDISSILSLEESGVTFKNFAGEEEDLFTVLADAEVNWVRVRVWNEPFSSENPDHGYGAGNVDAVRATEIAKRATDAGMRVLVNFHYSDFWAHPGQQKSPRAWRQMNLQERTQALYDYTAETLTDMKDAGADIGMVQIGNETTSGQIAGESGWGNTAELFKAGSQAVRDTLGHDVLVAVHFTNPERTGQYASVARELDARGVDYDVFLSSYYAFWHGSLENLTSVLDHVATTYDKYVAVAETSWAYTLEDGDGYPNSVADNPAEYSATVQGQALAVRDVMQAVANVSDGRGLGTFYWEPAWLPVGPPEQYDQNWELWQRDGSGWATTYSQEFYDPDGNLGGTTEEGGKDAEPYGGSSWDNQALFDFAGNPLESLRVYEYARTGAVSEREIDRIITNDISVTDPADIELPETVEVAYTDGTREELSVRWNEDPSWIVDDGEYTFTGSTEMGDVRMRVTVRAASAGGKNYVINPGFEDGVSPWLSEGSGVTVSASDDPHSGSRSTHFFSSRNYSFGLEQTLSGVPAGTYVLSAKVQGGDAATTDEMEISAQSGISTVRASFTLAGWQEWQTPRTEPITVGTDGTVIIRADFSLTGGAWGTIDDFEFIAVADSDPVSTDALRTLVTEAEQVDPEGFTKETVAALNATLVQARFILGGEPGQASVDAAAQALEAALTGLEPIATPDPIPDPDPTEVPDPAPEESDPDLDAGMDDNANAGTSNASGKELPRTGVSSLGWVLGLGFGSLALGAAVLIFRNRSMSGAR